MVPGWGGGGGGRCQLSSLTQSGKDLISFKAKNEFVELVLRLNGSKYYKIHIKYPKTLC